MPCLTLNSVNGVGMPVFADCIGTLPSLATFPTHHRWQFIGLAP